MLPFDPIREFKKPCEQRGSVRSCLTLYYRESDNGWVAGRRRRNSLSGLQLDGFVDGPVTSARISHALSVSGCFVDPARWIHGQARLPKFAGLRHQHLFRNRKLRVFNDQSAHIVRGEDTHIPTLTSRIDIDRNGIRTRDDLRGALMVFPEGVRAVTTSETNFTARHTV